MPVDQEEAPAADPGRITTQQEFGQQLTRARQHAGRTVRDVAKAAGIPASTAGDYTLAVGSADKTVRLWNVSDLAHPTRLGRPLTGPGGYVYSVQFSPDGRTLAAGVTDGTVWLWRLDGRARPGLLATLTGPADQVYSVAFSPGGGALAAASADGTVRLWDTTAPAAARAVCGTAGQPLTQAEWAAYLPGRAYQPPCPAR